MADGGAIAQANIINYENMLGKATVVDRQQVTFRKLINTEEGIHQELIIHFLEAKVLGVSA